MEDVSQQEEEEGEERVRVGRLNTHNMFHNQKEKEAELQRPKGRTENHKHPDQGVAAILIYIPSVPLLPPPLL